MDLIIQTDPKLNKALTISLDNTNETIFKLFELVFDCYEKVYFLNRQGLKIYYKEERIIEIYKVNNTLAIFINTLYFKVLNGKLNIQYNDQETDLIYTSQISLLTDSSIKIGDWRLCSYTDSSRIKWMELRREEDEGTV